MLQKCFLNYLSNSKLCFLLQYTRHLEITLDCIALTDRSREKIMYLYLKKSKGGSLYRIQDSSYGYDKRLLYFIDNTFKITYTITGVIICTTMIRYIDKNYNDKNIIFYLRWFSEVLA